MRQELLSINQSIVNHFMTVNALEMSRDDLIPLIGAEYAICQGNSIEKQSIELSQNVITLFQSLLSQNIESTISNLKELEHLMLPIDTFTRINADVENYLQNLSETQALVLSNSDNSAETNKPSLIHLILVLLILYCHELPQYQKQCLLSNKKHLFLIAT